MFNALATCGNKVLPVQEPGHVYIHGTIPAIVAPVHQGNRFYIFKQLLQGNCTAEF
jgi:hypothetical protein